MVPYNTWTVGTPRVRYRQVTGTKVAWQNVRANFVVDGRARQSTGFLFAVTFALPGGFDHRQVIF